MPKDARKGDPISHGGQIVEGSDTTFDDGGIPVARKGDAVDCAIHGSQKISTGSDTTFVDGKACARVGDSISCGAVITDGSPKTNVD